VKNKRKPSPPSFRLHAATKKNLLMALRARDIAVPPRTFGRENHHSETWTICRLLSTLGHDDRLAYPLSVTKQERPDFLLLLPDAQVGIEIVDATSEVFDEVRAFAEKEFPHDLIDTGHFRWGFPRRTESELRALLGPGGRRAKPWYGNDAEEEWAFFVQQAVDKKLKKLANPKFAKFDRNWLSIYDNAPLPSIHLDEAIAHLEPLLADRWPSTPSFDAVFIERGRVIVRMTAYDHEVLPLHDLWTGGSSDDPAPVGEERNDS
jgi:hypothetical protein